MQDNNLLHPDHYSNFNVDFTTKIDLMDVFEYLPTSIANAIKYIARRNYKGDYINDTKKAITYLEQFLNQVEMLQIHGDISKYIQNLYTSRKCNTDQTTYFTVNALIEKTSRCFTMIEGTDEDIHDLKLFVQNLQSRLKQELEQYSKGQNDELDNSPKVDISKEDLQILGEQTITQKDKEDLKKATQIMDHTANFLVEHAADFLEGVILLNNLNKKY